LDLGIVMENLNPGSATLVIGKHNLILINKRPKVKN
jgi:hypothetical protein